MFDDFDEFSYDYDSDEYEEGWEELFSIEHSEWPDDINNISENELLDEGFALATALGFAEEMSVKNERFIPEKDSELISLWDEKNEQSGKNIDSFINLVSQYIENIKLGKKKVGDHL